MLHVSTSGNCDMALSHLTNGGCLSSRQICDVKFTLAMNGCLLSILNNYVTWSGDRRVYALDTTVILNCQMVLNCFIYIAQVQNYTNVRGSKDTILKGHCQINSKGAQWEI